MHSNFAFADLQPLALEWRMGYSFLSFLGVFFALALVLAPKFLSASASQRMEQMRSLSAAIDSRLAGTASKRSGIPSGAYVCNGRLTTESGVPVSTSDRTGQTTLYFTPYHGNGIALYDGTTWVNRTFSELSVSLTGLYDNTTYDVFLRDVAGTLSLEISAGWSTAHNRTSEITLFEGVYTYQTDPLARYLGTIHTTSTTTTEDSALKRFVWNYCNRVPRHLVITETTDSWFYQDPYIRSTNNNSANRVEWALGFPEAITRSFSLALSVGDSTARAMDGSTIGRDSIFDSDSQLRGLMNRDTLIQQSLSEYQGFPRVGYDYLGWNERAETGNTYYGDNGGDDRIRPGLVAWIEN